MAEFGIWLAEPIASILIGEGMRYILSKKHTSKFKKVLKHSTFHVAKQFEDKYPDESRKLRSKSIVKKLYKTLHSPTISKESFISVLVE